MQDAEVHTSADLLGVDACSIGDLRGDGVVPQPAR
jgi:hypothetical protein